MNYFKMPLPPRTACPPKGEKWLAWSWAHKDAMDGVRYGQRDRCHFIVCPEMGARGPDRSEGQRAPNERSQSCNTSLVSSP